MAPQAKPQVAQAKSGRLENLKDVRWEPLYDTAVIPASALTKSSIRFFSTPIGGSKTLLDTNMVSQSQLPSPNVFTCFGIKMEAYVNLSNKAHIADLNLLSKLAMDSYVRFFVGTKDYFTEPLSVIMGKIEEHVTGMDVATGVARSLMQFGKPSHFGFRFPKDQFVTIGSNENFGVEWVIDTAAITPNNAVSFKLYLDGLRAVDVR
jgi:hypothetical protein